ncbi:MAG: uracil-DNA glycosylase [Candidatus Neomarinimicrobiota bacterium]
MNDNLTYKNPTVESHPVLKGRQKIVSLYKEIVECNFCPRLVEFRTRIANEKRKQFKDWIYWGRPVPGYGDIKAELIIIGLAPAAHGGNRTGRVFTGDKSADFLMNCLHSAGFSNQKNSDNLGDGLKLQNAFMTPVLKCVPPGDKPTARELRNCFDFFEQELSLLINTKIVLALGKIAFDAYLRFLRKSNDFKIKNYPFGHNKLYKFKTGKILWASFHPSPRNVNTKRLTFEMMMDLLIKIKLELKNE